MQRLAEQQRFQKAIVEYQEKFATERNKLAIALQRNRKFGLVYLTACLSHLTPL